MANGTEVELAVARGDTYLHRVRFRPSTILTVGSNPMTTIRLDGGGIPDFLEFLNISPDGALLRFTPEIQVEVLSGTQVLATRALIDGGYARRSGDAYGVDLEIGGKAVVRMGGYKLMLKIDPVSDAEVCTVQTPTADAAACGKCGTNLRLVLAGGGALTPCGACGALNRVTLAGTKQQQLEDQATRVAMPAGVPGMTPPAQPEALDPGSSTGRAVGDLPTFDAISVMKDDSAPEGAADLIKDLGLDSPGKPSGVTNLASPDAADPGSSTGRAASDLPTFDAIAVLKDDAPAPKKVETVNLAGGSDPEPPPATEPTPEPEPEPTPAPEPAFDPASEAPTPEPEPAVPTPPPAEEVYVPETPPAAEPAPAPAPAQDDGLPSTGAWEETLTIAAVKPKSKSILPWVLIGGVAVLGILALGCAALLKVLGVF